MKKLLGIVFVLGLGLLLVNGCQTSSSSSSESVPADTVAADIGTLAKNSLAIDNGILGVVTTLTLSISEPKAATPSIPTYSANWWSSTDSYTYGSLSYDISYKFRVWDTNGTEITTLSGWQAISSSADISALWTYTTITYTFTGGSYTISYGASTSDPLKFAGYNTSETVTGPMTFTSTYSGDTYSITYTYGGLTVTGGYPDGTLDWSVSSNGSTVYAGQIVFNGTNTATMTFTTGASGSYSVNLDTGTVTATSLN